MAALARMALAGARLQPLQHLGCGLNSDATATVTASTAVDAAAAAAGVYVYVRVRVAAGGREMVCLPCPAYCGV